MAPSARRRFRRLPVPVAAVLAVLALLVAAAGHLVSAPLSGATAEPASGLGVNLSALTDYSDEDPFLNRFLLSREWMPQCVPDTDPGCTAGSAWDTGEQALIDTDASGWVTRLPESSDGPVFTRVSTLLMVAPAPDSGLPHNDYAGRYVVRYSGSGVLEYSLGARLVSRSPGRDVIVVEPDGSALLTITATDPTDHLRDISVVRAADEALAGTERFSPTWLERLAPFRTLRFMDWMRTNGSTQRTPEDLPSVTDARYTTDAGAPVEVMVDAANRAGAEPWFTMPHRATDDYVAAFATTVRAGLAPGRTVYVEYSNEVWNGAFPQGDEVESWAEAEFAESAESGFTKRMNWHGRRTAEVCGVWRRVFGADSARIVCVLGAQAATPYTATEALDCPLWRADPDNPEPGPTCQERGIDAVAIAPYVGGYLGDPLLSDQVRGLTLDGLFAELAHGGQVADPGPADRADVPAGGALAQAQGWIRQYDEMASARGLRLLAYEGGQHLVGIGAAQDDPAVTSLFVAANRDPRMGDIYRRHLADWRSAAQAQVFTAFAFAGRYGRFGSWGVLEHVEQGASPKYDALVGFAAEPCWWPGCVVSGTRDPAPAPAMSQRPVRPLGVPRALRRSGWTRLLQLPVRTNAGQRAQVALACRPVGDAVRRPAVGCRGRVRVDRDPGRLRARPVDGPRVRIVLTLTAPAVPGYAPYRQRVSVLSARP